MELLKVKTARFRDLVARFGAPQPVTLWSNPAKNRALQKSIREQRILTVHRAGAGGAKDFGEIGFIEGDGKSYLEFPQTLKPVAGKRIVGIDYSLLAAEDASVAAEEISEKKQDAPRGPKRAARAEKKVRPAVKDPHMRAAIEEAKRGLAEGGIPIGSALVRKGKLVAVGHNKRVQDNDPVTHAETDCLRNAGRLGSYRGCTLYSTLMPCFYCAGATVQFGIRKVVVGESRNFTGAPEFMREHGIEVVNLDLPDCYEMMEQFIRANPALWHEDIGVD